jgi:O-methyltransferase involved in polyketide biosynthesis
VTDDSPLPDSLNTHVPHPARVYDYWLGGKNNFAVDRVMAEKLIAANPGTRESVRANREFLKRAVRYAAAMGVRQFIDIGSGLPAAENTHEIAQHAMADARVVYVDKDPLVRVHGQALLATTESTAVIQADLREPEAIVNHPEVRSLIDFDRPVALLLLGVLHFVLDDAVAREITDRLRRHFPLGSHLVVSHLTADSDPEGMARFLSVLEESPDTEQVVPRTRDQVSEFFEGFEIVDPGIVSVDQWRPEHRVTADRFWLWAGVGRTT